MHSGHFPVRLAALDLEQAFARTDVDSISHKPLLSAGKRLENEDFIVGSDCIGEIETIPHRASADIDRDVPAKRSLVVQHVATQSRIGAERHLQRLAHGCAWHRRRGDVEKAAQMASEGDPRHATRITRGAAGGTGIWLLIICSRALPAANSWRAMKVGMAAASASRTITAALRRRRLRHA